jgi:hypothetical protein
MCVQATDFQALSDGSVISSRALIPCSHTLKSRVNVSIINGKMIAKDCRSSELQRRKIPVSQTTIVQILNSRENRVELRRITSLAGVKANVTREPGNILSAKVIAGVKTFIEAVELSPMSHEFRIVK